MFYGSLFILLGVVCYVSNVFLITHYIDKEAPGLFDMDLTLPPPVEEQEYLWEKTAGTGVVPKWVSILGLSSILWFLIGVIVVIASALT